MGRGMGTVLMERTQFGSGLAHRMGGFNRGDTEARREDAERTRETS